MRLFQSCACGVVQCVEYMAVLQGGLMKTRSRSSGVVSVDGVVVPIAHNNLSHLHIRLQS